MDHRIKRLALLGSTGSIGSQTLDVVRAYPKHLQVVGLAARSNVMALNTQIKEFQPKFVSCENIGDEEFPLVTNGYRKCSIEDMVRDPSIDLVVSATAGNASLSSTISAIEAGKNVALANKESIVMAGDLLTNLADENHVALLPIDSEPNAIWQCLQGEKNTVRKLIITASGGAFRNIPKSKLASMTPEEALIHPTWKMGPKITVDSATLVNKAFEVIEAHWMFGVPWEDINVVIHPQSMIHSMVEFVDGSVKAQISNPDMRIPIQYALLHPERVENNTVKKFDPLETSNLTFSTYDPSRYPCFQLALEIGMRGATWPAVLCGADEAAVELFLSGQIGFLEIEDVIRVVTNRHKPKQQPTATDILYAASWASEQAFDIFRK